MKKIIFLFIIILSITCVKADFSNFTQITENKTFDKIHGDSNILYLYEDYIINPFKDSTIVANKTSTNGGTPVLTSYSVDGIIFNGSHIKFKNSNSIKQDWTTDSIGITTKIEYLEKTYTTESGIYKPVQSVKVRKYYKIPISYDTTKPTCGDVKLYNDIDLTQPFSYNGGWLNNTKYYTMVCSDPETGCKCDTNSHSCENVGSIVRTPALPLAYKAKPKATFKNNVNLLKVACEGNLPNGVNNILYDKKAPKVDLYLSGTIDLNSNNEGNRTYLSGNGNGKLFYSLKYIPKIKAGTKNIKFNIIDEYLSGSVYGVSGLKNINIKTYRITDLNHNNINELELTNNGCFINNNFSEYNSDGSIEETDKRGENINLNCDEFKKSGRYKILINILDWAGNETKIIAYFDIFPNTNIQPSVKLLPSNNKNSKYANNSDYYEYELNLTDNFGNPIYNKTINYINQEKNDATSNISGEFKTIKSNMINNSGYDAIEEYGNLTTNNNGTVIFKVKSIAPGDFTERFRIKLNKWDDNYNNISEIFDKLAFVSGGNNTNSFKKPFIGKINGVSNNNGNTWNDEPEIGTSQKYLFKVNKKSNLNYFKILNFKNNIEPLTSELSLTGVTNISNVDISNQTENTDFIFSASINTSNDASGLSQAGIKINNIIINYNLNGKNVKYYLTQNDYGTDNTTIDIKSTKTNGGFKGIAILGIKQGGEKSDITSEITGNRKNFSDLYQSKLRKIIKSNAYKLIRGLTPNKNIKANGIIYAEGNVKYSEINLENNETIIIKNGNFIIDADMPTDKTIGIIVLKPEYNTKTDFENFGNIYINNDVEYINAIMYADGGLISSYNGTPYIVDNSMRTSELQTQLVMKGSLFTRNTIAGAIKIGGYFLLPGGEKTTNFDKAMIYDLNYLRRGEGIANSLNQNRTNPFVIIYNPEIQSNPPKGFEQ